MYSNLNNVVSLKYDKGFQLYFLASYHLKIFHYERSRRRRRQIAAAAIIDAIKL